MFLRTDAFQMEALVGYAALFATYDLALPLSPRLTAIAELHHTGSRPTRFHASPGHDDSAPPPKHTRSAAYTQKLRCMCSVKAHLFAR